MHELVALISPWQYVVWGAGLICVFVTAPWLIGLLCRSQGQPVPTRRKRVLASFLAALVPGLVTPLALGLLLGLLLEILRSESISLVVETFALTLLVVFSVFLALVVTRACLRSAASLPWRQWLVVGSLVGGSAAGFDLAASAYLTRVRTQAKRAIDGASLNAIGKGLFLYYQDHGAYPDDLRGLVDEGTPEPKLVATFGGSRDQIPERVTKPYQGPCDFEYIPLPDDAPEDLVWVWQSPKYHDGEGAWVLFKSAHVEWMTPDELCDRLGRTYAWLRHRERVSPPSTQPAASGPVNR
jgi:hypothetical protein